MFRDVIFLCFFFFKQKTAYEMRISDWSSDVCSSDLAAMTDGPFRNAELSGSWKQYGEDLVSDAASPGERTARICASLLGDVAWDSISPLLKQLDARARNSQPQLEPFATARTNVVAGKCVSRRVNIAGDRQHKK